MTARIYQRPLSAMSSGKARGEEWVLEYEPDSRQVHDPLTGWYGSSDTRRQVKLRFESEEGAVAYARTKGLDYSVEPPRVHRLKLQSYSDNFR
ncbi:ETC complex I subunit [Pacificimonas flava]|uniref:ETC complex I subunit n=2 Tax=Pacificimonas TaxID=1960290 RepID=A0A219B6B1_9SPHN|nr:MULTISPECIES: ETC complex I subunit [Pacificimonas]MBZ6378870.1 ETC complex I subunit [Pacificimonas aurantium]OWV33877.1 ETC complex I subunit [Pacificimonas flava]